MESEELPDNVVPLRPPFDRHNLGVEANRLREGIAANPGWAVSVEKKLQTFQWVQRHQKLVPEGMFKPLIHQLGISLGWTTERVARTLMLERVEEMRRAFLAQPIKLLRLPEEEIYPKTGWFGEYLLYAQNSEVPLGWHFWTAVGVISAAARRNIYLDRNNSYVFPNHYILIVGRTGMKKSTAMERGVELLDDLNELLTRTAEKPVKVIPDKVTPERFLSLIKSVPAGFKASTLTHIRQQWTSSAALFVVDELVTLFSKEAFHSGAMVQLLTDLYTCKRSFTSGTIGRGEDQLRNVSITFIGGTTLEWLKSSMTDDAAHGGFLGRCIVSYRRDCRRSFPKPEVLDPVVRMALAERLLPIVRSEDVMVTVRPDAEEIYEDFHAEFASKIAEDTRLTGYWSRKGTHCWKLAMILALAQDRREVHRHDMELANQILKTEEATQSAFFARLGTHHEADKGDRVIQFVRSRGGKVTEGEILNKMRRVAGSSNALRGILETVVSSGDMQREFDGRRRQNVYWVVGGVDND